MKVFLLHRDRDFDLEQESAPNADHLLQDLALGTLFSAMADGDAFALGVCRTVILSGLSCDVTTVRYRQEITRDCLANAPIIRAMYRLTVEVLEKQRKEYFPLLGSSSPRSTLHGAVRVLQMLTESLRELARIRTQHAKGFHSEGFRRFFAMIEEELDEDYFDLIASHLRQLRFPGGILVSARLGTGNEGVDYVLRKPDRKRGGWLGRLLGRPAPVHRFHLHPRDDAGARMLAELEDRGIAQVAETLSRSSEHVLSFFRILRAELAFYIGCINLHERLRDKGEPVCLPVPADDDDARLSFRGLYDVCLALNLERRAVGNGLDADDKALVMITGANQGGKSTFLRSLGLAQLMMQCGMFVPAVTFSADLRDRVFTHFKREEDAAMEMGKFEEELDRMSEILDHASGRSMVLFNESFASTNEREGSEIAAQIIAGLLDRGVKVAFVTHMFELAHGFYGKRLPLAIFLRAERRPDGGRTFKLLEGEPLQTSFGQDLYKEIFDDREPAALQEGLGQHRVGIGR